jgi:hypothetical protein
MHDRWCELSIDTVDLQGSAILFVPSGEGGGKDWRRASSNHHAPPHGENVYHGQDPGERINPLSGYIRESCKLRYSQQAYGAKVPRKSVRTICETNRGVCMMKSRLRNERSGCPRWSCSGNGAAIKKALQMKSRFTVLRTGETGVPWCRFQDQKGFSPSWVPLETVPMMVDFQRLRFRLAGYQLSANVCKYA